MGATKFGGVFVPETPNQYRGPSLGQEAAPYTGTRSLIVRKYFSRLWAGARVVPAKRSSAQCEPRISLYPSPACMMKRPG